MINKYIGMRYVPKIDGEWISTKEYEPLVVVTYQGTSYTSKTHVPKNIDITNSTYWIVSGEYNAQVAEYQQKVNELQGNIVELGKKTDVPILLPSGLVDATDSINAQALIDEYNVLKFGVGTFTFTKKINLKSGSIVMCDSKANVIINAVHTDFAFEYAPIGTSSGGRAPKFFDFRLTCTNGIKLNDPNIVIADESSETGQPYMMKPIFHNLTIYGKGTSIGNGLLLTKCFDTSIMECNIENFLIPIRTIGCDVTSITHNRITNGNILISVECPTNDYTNTFGSHVHIEHNDLLMCGECFIYSSDRYPVISHNFMEVTTTTCQYDVIFDFAHEIRMFHNKIYNNNSNAHFARFKQATYSYIYFVGNGRLGAYKYGVQFDKFRYYSYTFSYVRCVIIHHGNSNENGFPFINDTEDYLNTTQILFKPSLSGLCARWHGGEPQPNRDLYTCKNNAFVLPLMENYSQNFRFSPLAFSSAPYSPTGALAKVWMPSTLYAVDDIIIPSYNNGLHYICTTAGTSGTVEPNFNLDINGVTTDGTAVWETKGIVARGTYKVTLIAYADVDDALLVCRCNDGSTGGITEMNTTLTIGREQKEYVVQESITANISLGVTLNHTSGTPSNIYVKQIKLEKIS